MGYLVNNSLQTRLDVKAANSVTGFEFTAGNKIFNDLWNRFGGKANIKSIVSEWNWGTNLEKFNNYLKDIKNPTEEQFFAAVRETNSWKYAESVNYKKIEFPEGDLIRNPKNGLYESVLVQFSD